jgi:hypothetical protein
MGWFGGVFGRLAANVVVLNYTHLHAFTAFYHMFLGGNVTGINEAEFTTEIPRHRGETDWPQPSFAQKLRRAGVEWRALKFFLTIMTKPA